MKRKFVLGLILCFMAFLLTGCLEQLGENTAEGKRRHTRVLRTNQQELMSDIDKVLLMDKPSRLTDKRIP
jgi:hypothetical protein